MLCTSLIYSMELGYYGRQLSWLELKSSHLNTRSLA